MLERWVPQSKFWRVALIVFWIGAAIAGVLTTSRYVDVCDQDEHTQQQHCASHHIASFVLLKVKKALSDWEPVLVGIGTLAIAAFTWRLWVSTAGLWHHARAVERAYVKMSHLPPGVAFQEGGKAKVTIQVNNRGRTPAYVTDVRLSTVVLPRGEALPQRPRYKAPDGQSAQAFLTSTDHIFIDMEFAVPDLAAILAGTKNLYFVGYVDYVDAFKGRHRGGYARVYNQSEKTNNLVFVTSSAYNYDTSRPEGVGRDWGEDYA
jgi:4-amino-4-deoxy-L-arabinose transferase-like glycosyltransferase